MKKIIIILAVVTFGFLSSCQKTEFADAYPNPAKISSTTVEKQFAGFLQSNSEYIIPGYWNYFVVLRNTILYYTQTVGWQNVSGQYVTGAASVSAFWGNYYGFLSQYREFQNVFAEQTADDQNLKRIYMIAATIYLYDYTEKLVDLHGDIPWSTAGMISKNGGDYNTSFATYDDATTVYTKMLDDLKAFSDELNSITVISGVQAGFKNQDFINHGSLANWKKYCNSLRMRMLTRVSGVSSLSSRASTEIAQILGNSTSYPVPAVNGDNIMIDVFDLNSNLNAKGFRDGLESWTGTFAGKVMVDHMKTNADPRLRAMYETGVNAAGVYKGLDPLLDAGAQGTLINDGTLSFANRSTFSRNQYFPGILMSAAEVQFYAAEYYLKAGNDVAAKTAYENGIKQSILWYYWVRSISNDNTAIALVPTSDTEINAYIAATGVSWGGAATATAKLQLIATQKWLHLNIIEPYENWAELRRLKLPALSFQTDNSNPQSLPPSRWLYPSSEISYNPTNYAQVAAKDKMTTKIFWDVK